MPKKYILQPPAPSIPLTAAAYAENKLKYNQLTILRKEVMERLKIAREMGDLSENGAYTYAKFELGSIGRQLRTLKYLLANGYIAQTATTTDTAEFGNTITICNLATKKELTFLLIDEHESDPTNHKLSLQSPIGQAVKGKRVGAKVVVQTPAGQTQYQILTIA